MFSILASTLLLGIVPAAPLPVESHMPPGIEVLSVSEPSPVREHFVAPSLSASGVILLDAQSGEEIFSVDPDVQRPMASLTKIMTALLILENHNLREIVTIPPIAEQIGGSTIGLVPGQQLTVESLLKATLLPSANEAAYSLAAFDGRNVGSFVQKMNRRAEALGLTSTHFTNPAGLDNTRHYSSPRDMAFLTMAALKHAVFRSMVSTRSTRIVALDGTDFSLKNSNEMLHYNEDVFGVKTGTTTQAGECLVLLFTEQERSYLLVLLGSRERYTDALRILQAIRDAQQ